MPVLQSRRDLLKVIHKSADTSNKLVNAVKSADDAAAAIASLTPHAPPQATPHAPPSLIQPKR